MLLGCGVLSAAADWVELKDGTGIRCHVMIESDRSVTIEGPGGEREIPRDQIQFIRMDPRHYPHGPFGGPVGGAAERAPHPAK